MFWDMAGQRWSENNGASGVGTRDTREWREQMNDEVEVSEIDILLQQYQGKMSDIPIPVLDEVIAHVRKWRALKESGQARSKRPRRTTDAVSSTLLDTIFGPPKKPTPQPSAVPPTRR